MTYPSGMNERNRNHENDSNSTVGKIFAPMPSSVERSNRYLGNTWNMH